MKKSAIDEAFAEGFKEGQKSAFERLGTTDSEKCSIHKEEQESEKKYCGWCLMDVVESVITKNNTKFNESQKAWRWRKGKDGEEIKYDRLGFFG